MTTFEFYKEENLKNYLRWLEASSEYLKVILKEIKGLGLREDSIILVFSDHGASVGDRTGEKNWGTYLYDYTLRCFLYLM